VTIAAISLSLASGHCSLRPVRMNVPGRAGGNWRWRWQEDIPSLPPLEWLKELTETSKRWSPATPGQQKAPERVVAQVGQQTRSR
jgi:4-alpha-glucanotransferase